MLMAALPYFEIFPSETGLVAHFGSTVLTIPTFGIPIDPWATLVAIGCLLGMEVSRARAIKMGLDVRDIVDGILFTVLCGFIMAHWVSVIFYRPDLIQEKGLLPLFTFEGGFSSTGGFIGGLLGLVIFYRFIRPRELSRFADLIAFGFPVGWFFGRLGCSVVHDHVGKATDSAFGMTFPPTHRYAGTHFEMGLIEMLLTIPMIAFFMWYGRKDRPGWTFMGLFFLLYAPIRFGLDYLRTDVRYGALTPAQYGMIGLFAFGGLLLWFRKTDGFEPNPMTGAPDPEPAPE